VSAPGLLAVAPSDFNSLAYAVFRAENAELGGGSGDDGCPQKMTAIIVDFFFHFSISS
jgi:hypothetical protein